MAIGLIYFAAELEACHSFNVIQLSDQILLTWICLSQGQAESSVLFGRPLEHSI